MTINNATVEQINVALLDIDKRIKALNIDNEAIKSLQNSVKTIKSSLNETKAGLQSGATYNINISGNASTATKAATATTAEIVNVAESAAEANHAKVADTATNANISKTLDAINGDKLQIGSGTAQNITNAKHAVTADNGVPVYSTSDAGKNLAVNSSGNAVGWIKPQTVKFVDYKTESLTFSSSTDQKKIELSNFGPEVTEDNVLNFMVIYWSGVYIVAQGDWAKSHAGSSGLACSLHALTAGTGWCVIRCVYLA